MIYKFVSTPVILDRLWPNRIRKAWYALVVVSLMIGGVYVRIGGMRATPARLLGVVLFCALLLKVATRRKVNLGASAGTLLLVWLLMSLGVDLIRDDRLELIRHWFNITSGIVWFYVVLNARVDWDILWAAGDLVGRIVGVGALLVLCGLAIRSDLGGAVSMLTTVGSSGQRLSMLAWEPNIFGALVAMLLLIRTATAMRRRRPSWFGYLPSALLVVALIGSLSKGPWLALVVGLATYATLCGSNRAVARVAAFTGGGALALAGSLTLMPDRVLLVTARAHNFTVRLAHIAAALDAFFAHPLIGNGTFSLSVLFPSINTRFGSAEHAWAGVTLVSLLADTGIIGTALYTVFLTILIAKATSAIRSSRWRADERCELSLIRRRAAAIVAMAAVLLTMGVATTMYDLPVYWAVMGLVARVPRLMRSEERSYSARCR